ncbi:DUF2809 domain-containing protein [Vibrio sp. TH_r3]|uniref:ribosomal maturation YjgA family protein n=1 Tax=Vibrio sp. TH_r3 TaxID=3082084 RepID=UPI0029552645|nr:DUF2809 domain-containing protein [Vibrio sp. TH_r3]MDV7106258.1 DUF2809 domain-containing protein [Vibrio sp. TH_r3]
MIKLNKGSLIKALLLLIVLVYIALYIKGDFVRAYFGDFLVVIFIYYFVRAFIDITPYKLIISVVLFSYLVELAQYFDVLYLLGLNENPAVSIVIGTTFDWIDILIYSLGGTFIALVH